MTLVVLEDIVGEKRREAHEQMFFHDLLNTLSGLHGYPQLWEAMTDDELREFGAMIRPLSQ